MGSRGEGSAARVLRLQPPMAGADTRDEDVNAYFYNRSRPYKQSFRANVVDMNVISFAFVVSVAIVDAATAVAAATAATAVAAAADVFVSDAVAVVL